MLIKDSITTIVPVLLLQDRVFALNETLSRIPHSNTVVMVDGGDPDLIPLIDTSNIRQLVHRQNNIGQWLTRYEGLNYVDTEYVHFLDADDYLSEDAYDAPGGHEMYQLIPRVFNGSIVVDELSRVFLTACSCQIFKTEMARKVMASLPIGTHNYNECFYFMLQAYSMGYRDFVHHDSTVQRLLISGEMFKDPPMPGFLGARVKALANQDFSRITDYHVHKYFTLRAKALKETRCTKLF